MIPKIVFIIPYRDREEHYKIFSEHMKSYKPYNSEIYYIHQTDDRPFNRGAMKNIGFLVIKEKYPSDYKSITLVFNDIDSMLPKKVNYETTFGKIKHFYGFNQTLGGIVSIKMGDFEKINGFPNLWSWGYEDNSFYLRAKKYNLSIDRSIFYEINDRRFIRLKEGNTRIINRDDFNMFKRDIEGLMNIHNLSYNIDDSNFVNIKSFNTGREPNYNNFKIHDIRNGNNVFQNIMKMSFL